MRDFNAKTMTSGKRWAAWALLIPGTLLPVAAQQTNSLSVTGKTGSAKVIHVHGRGYVDVEDLVRLLNASLRINGSQILLSFSEADPAASAEPGFSKVFVTSSIEALAEQREWRAALKYAIEGGYPLTESWIAAYRARAQQAVQIASVNATTASDQNAAPFLKAQFDKLSSLSDKYLGMAASLSFIDRNSLNNDSLDRSIMACNRSLSSMATANQFVDDGTCH
jgi:hypothetical protein